jgi:hypothetical protein
VRARSETVLHGPTCRSSTGGRKVEGDFHSFQDRGAIDGVGIADGANAHRVNTHRNSGMIKKLFSPVTSPAHPDTIHPRRRLRLWTL